MSTQLVYGPNTEQIRFLIEAFKYSTHDDSILFASIFQAIPDQLMQQLAVRLMLIYGSADDIRAAQIRAALDTLDTVLPYSGIQLPPGAACCKHRLGVKCAVIITVLALVYRDDVSQYEFDLVCKPVIDYLRSRVQVVQP